MVSAATDGSSGSPSSSASLAASMITWAGSPWYGGRVSARPAAGSGSGRIDSNSTAAASTALVDTGVSRSPVMHRSYRSIAP